MLPALQAWSLLASPSIALMLWQTQEISMSVGCFALCEPNRAKITVVCTGKADVLCKAVSALDLICALGGLVGLAAARFQ